MVYPYVLTTDKFKKFLLEIPVIGKPNKMTLTKIKSMGYKSSNHERFLPAIKFIGLIDSNGVPTARWQNLRGNFKTALADAIIAGYNDLFSQYPNAQQRDNEALKTYFGVHTNLGDTAVTSMVGTFKAFCDLADFSQVVKGAETLVQVVSEPSSSAGDSQPTVSRTFVHGDGITVNINVQLQLPPDPTGDIYDKFFVALKKHLLDDGK